MNNWMTKNDINIEWLGEVDKVLLGSLYEPIYRMTPCVPKFL